MKIPFVKIFYFFHQDFGGENESFKLKVAGLKFSGLRLQRKVSVIKKNNLWWARHPYSLKPMMFRSFDVSL